MVFRDFTRFAEKHLLNQTQHVNTGQDDAKTSDNRRDLAHTPKTEKYKEFSNKAGRTRNCNRENACHAKEEAEHRITARKAAHLVEAAVTCETFRRARENEEGRSRKSVSNKHHEHRREHFHVKRKDTGNRKPQVAHGAEGEKLLDILGTHRHKGAVHSRQKAESEKKHAILESDFREDRNHPEVEAVNASLRHGTRQNSAQACRSFCISLCLPTVQREERSLYPERCGKAPEENRLRGFRKSLRGLCNREHVRRSCNGNQIPESDCHRSRTDERVKGKVRCRFTTFRSSVRTDEDCCRENERFKEEEEQHRVRSEERTVQGSEKCEHSNGEVAVVTARRLSSADQSGQRNDISEEHHPSGESIHRKGERYRYARARDCKPFHRSGVVISCKEKRQASAEERRRKNHRKARCRTGILTRSGNHEKGGEERSKNQCV